MDDDDDLPPEHISPVDLEQCESCGRNFNSDTLARHRNICLKTKKRQAILKPFDTAKQRATGTDLEAFNAAKKYNRMPSERAKQLAYERQEQKKKQWRRKHEDFIESIRAAREYDVAAKTGVPIGPPEPSAPNPDYVQCPYCKRRFQEHAAERHIPFCKDQNDRIERKVSGSNSSALTKRLKYRPPLPRKRTGTEGAVSYNPPGSNIPQRKTNFSSTYTVDDSNDDSMNYQASGANRRPGSESRELSSNRVGGTAMQKLPGNTPKIRKPHPPSKLVPPGTRTRLVHTKRAENTAQHTSPQHGRVTNGYIAELDDQGRPHFGNPPQNARNLRSRDGAKDGLSHGSEPSDDRSSNEEDRVQKYVLDQKRRGPLRRIYSDVNSHNSQSDSSTIQRSGHDSAPSYNSVPLPFPGRDRMDNDTAYRVHSGPCTISQRTRNLQLNEHGMCMAKFCYECGSKFPVPQAKYCCECGTKRV